MSAANTGTPAVESCSASSWSVLVLPVPVAPATRPCRLSMPSGIRMGTPLRVVASTISPPSSSAGPSKAYPGATAALIGSWHGPGARHAGQRQRRPASPYDGAVIFKRVGDGRPYPAHDLGPRDWAALPPRPVRLDDLVTTKDTLQLAALLDEDSTFFGDLFAHVVEWHDELYLEDGLHRALRAALQQRHVLHARVHVIED